MTVSEQIIQVLDNLCMKFGLAIDWTSENVIPYLTTLGTKLVSFEIWSSVAWLILTVIPLLVTVVLITKHRRVFVNWLTDSAVAAPIVAFVMFPAGACCIACIINQIMDIIKCVTFPEMFIFEYIQNLLRTAH